MSDQVEPLSDREIEILRLVATGASNKEIAGTLVISPNTVKVHLRNIFAKIGVVSRTEATLFAIKNGIVASPELTQSASEALPVQTPQEIFLASPMAIAQVEIAADPVLPIPARRPVRIYLLVAAILVLAAIAISAVLVLIQRPTPPAQPTAVLLPTPSPVTISRWLQFAAMPDPKVGMGAVLYSDAFYLFAGSNGAQPMATVYKLDPSSDQWQSLAAKPTAVEGIQAGLLGERIYLPGGMDANHQSVANLEVYNPRLNAWESKKPIPQALAYYALAAFEGRLFLFGGLNGSEYSKNVWIYDPADDTWKTGSPLPTPRAHLAAEVVDGKIILIGGFDGSKALDEVLIYYPTRDVAGDSPWANGPILPEGRYAMSSASIANMVFVFGGKYDASRPAFNALMLESSLKKWSGIPTPVANLGFDGAARVNGNFIHLFGGEQGTHPSGQHWSYQAIYTISIPFTNNP